MINILACDHSSFRPPGRLCGFSVESVETPKGSDSDSALEIQTLTPFVLLVFGQ